MFFGLFVYVFSPTALAAAHSPAPSTPPVLVDILAFSYFQVTEASLDALFALGKLSYEAGRYAVSARLLSYFRRLVAADMDVERGLRALWGLLASEIMLARWDAAAEHVNDLSVGLEKVRRGANRLGTLSPPIFPFVLQHFS